MRIAFDPAKRRTNLEKHGLDFADLDEAFFLNSTVMPAKQGRFMATGDLGPTVVTVVFAPLGTEAISIVSMRYASRKERSHR